MSDFNDKNGFSADEPQWKTIEELIREIREEKEAAGERPDADGNDPSAAGQELFTDEETAAVPAPEAEGGAVPLRNEKEAPVQGGQVKSDSAMLQEPAEETGRDEQNHFINLDWGRVLEMSARKLAGSDLNWELPEEEEPVSQSVPADQEPTEESVEEVVFAEEAVSSEETEAAEAKQEVAEADSDSLQEASEAEELQSGADGEESPAEMPAGTAAPAEETAPLSEAAEGKPENTEAIHEASEGKPEAGEAIQEAADETALAAKAENGKPEEEAAETEKTKEDSVSPSPAAASAKETAKTDSGAEKKTKEEKPKRRRGVHPVSVIVTAALLAALFFGVFHISFPIDYDNLGGEHSWLSGSTITFVNNWLKESPQALHFINYNDAYSVETKNLADRNPYVSYPSGTTFFVYAAAKITGHQQIDISFLKHFQMIWYLVEAVLLAWFVMLLTGGSGYRSESGKVVLGFMTGAIWILMPVNLWYLSNVYFTDQAVILWVMLFLPVEYIIRVKEKGGWINGEDIHALSRVDNRKRLQKGHAPLLLHVLRFLIIYTGMLIDYYFWILVFMAFFTEFIGDLLNKRGFGRAAFRSLGYIVPVIAALLTFWWQVSAVENWQGLLMERFIFRTMDDCAGLEEIRKFFCRAFTADSEEMLQWMIYYNLVILVLSIVYLIFHRGPARLFKSSQCSILITAFTAIVFQVLLLKQHSGVHEFSQIKVSWWIAMMPAVSAILVLKILAPENREGKSRNPSLSWLMLLFMLSFSATLYITQIPSVDREYYQFRDHKESYPIEQALRDNTGYQDVCFSFTYEISNAPPQKLAVSGKKVYRIASLDEIAEMFPDLWMDHARLLMIYEKASEELTLEQNDVIYAIFDPEAVVVDNSSCTIFEIPDWIGLF